MSRYKRLPKNLQQQLERIEPSVDRDIRYYPCLVTLADGRIVDRVYVTAEAPYFRYWGVFPEDDAGKHSVPIENVRSISESPSRLPARFANQLYAEGESGMGYFAFGLAFKDGSECHYLLGNAIDFVSYPSGKGPNDIDRVVAHAGRELEHAEEPPYYWCLYEA